MTGISLRIVEENWCISYIFLISNITSIYGLKQYTFIMSVSVDQESEHSWDALGYHKATIKVLT